MEFCKIVKACNNPDAPELVYRAKYVSVKGNIEEYKGRPQIIVRSPVQIEVISENSKQPGIKE